MEVAAFVLDKPLDKAQELIEHVKNHPEDPLEELYEEIITGTSKISAIVYLDRKTIDALGDACMEKQTYRRKLISRIIIEWLDKNGYIVKQIEEAKIDKLSFRVGRHRVTVQPTILIEGYPPIFFSIKEVKEKAWNRNQKLPSRLINVLNTLKIELRKK